MLYLFFKHGISILMQFLVIVRMMRWRMKSWLNFVKLWAEKLTILLDHEIHLLFQKLLNVASMSFLLVLPQWLIKWMIQKHHLVLLNHQCRIVALCKYSWSNDLRISLLLGALSTLRGSQTILLITQQIEQTWLHALRNLTYLCKFSLLIKVMNFFH